MFLFTFSTDKEEIELDVEAIQDVHRGTVLEPDSAVKETSVVK